MPVGGVRSIDEANFCKPNSSLNLDSSSSSFGSPSEESGRRSFQTKNLLGPCNHVGGHERTGSPQLLITTNSSPERQASSCDSNRPVRLTMDLSVEEVHKTAKSYTLQDAVRDFNLKYDSEPVHAEQYLWKIEALTDVKMMEPSVDLLLLLNNYMSIYDSPSKAACRPAVNLLLCDCVGQMSPPDRPSTPKPSANIKVCCEVSFTHKIDSKSRSNSVVGGRVDHSIGIVLYSMKKPNRRFRSLLLCVGAKVEGILSSALGELAVYLGSLRQSRISRGKPDSSVYGLATDGLNYIFVVITHEGVLMTSKQFNALHGDLPIVLGCLKYVLEKAMSMAQTQGEEMDGMEDADDVFNVDGRDSEDDTEDDVCKFPSL